MKALSCSRYLVACVLLVAGSVAPSTAEQSPAATRNSTPTAPNVPPPVVVPADYVIGPEDVLAIYFWREKDLSGDYPVAPDGKVRLPLINDIDAAGLTPEQLRDKVTAAATKFIAEPTVTVGVKQINSRKVFITGQIAKSGPYPLGGPTTLMQLIAMAGGLQEYADSQHISIVRVENGKVMRFEFNYKDFTKGKNLEKNILLKPGDTIAVP